MSFNLNLSGQSHNEHLRQENELLRKENERLKQENENLKLILHHLPVTSQASKRNALNQPSNDIANNKPSSEPRPLVSSAYRPLYLDLPQQSTNTVWPHVPQIASPQESASPNTFSETFHQINQANNEAVQRRIRAQTRLTLNQKLEFYCNVCHTGFSSIFDTAPCPKCEKIYEPVGNTQYPW